MAKHVTLRLSRCGYKALLERREFKPIKIAGEHNPADILTKLVPPHTCRGRDTSRPMSVKLFERGARVRRQVGTASRAAPKPEVATPCTHSIELGSGESVTQRSMAGTCDVGLRHTSHAPQTMGNLMLWLRRLNLTFCVRRRSRAVRCLLLQVRWHMRGAWLLQTALMSGQTGRTTGGYCGGKYVQDGASACRA